MLSWNTSSHVFTALSHCPTLFLVLFLGLLPHPHSTCFPRLSLSPSFYYYYYYQYHHHPPPKFVDLAAGAVSMKQSRNRNIVPGPQSATPHRPIGQLCTLWRPFSAHTFSYKTPPFSPAAFFSDAWPFKMGPINSPETSGLNQPTLLNIPENDTFQLDANSGISVPRAHFL